MDFRFVVDRCEGEIRLRESKQPLCRIAPSYMDPKGRIICECRVLLALNAPPSDSLGVPCCATDKKNYHVVHVAAHVDYLTMFALTLIQEEYKQRIIKCRTSKTVVTNSLLAKLGDRYTPDWVPPDPADLYRIENQRDVLNPQPPARPKIQS